MAIDYDTDVPKQFVRERGWLKAALQTSKTIGPGSGLRYLTFCAVEAIDVFLLDLHDLLDRDPASGKFRDVYFCERGPDAFREISGILGLQGFLGEFEDIVLFEEEEGPDTANLKPLDHEIEASEPQRRRLRVKRSAANFREAFPFDVINLDFDGTLFPPQQPADSRLFQAVKRVIEWQRTPPSGAQGPAEFTLFLTTRVDRDRFGSEALKVLIDLVEDNVDQDPGFKAGFAKRFSGSPADVAANDLGPFCAASLPKQILEDAVHLSWKAQYRDIFIYRRTPKNGSEYHMVSFVCHFTRMPKKVSLKAMRDVLAEATAIVANEPCDVDRELGDSAIRDTLRANLAAVVEHRAKATSP
ncbi:MAG: hypothetical protein WEE64_08500 [Dehalococcoidia bacterium]